MSSTITLIYPTRHRPSFIKQALQILERQRYADFEVVVSDNFADPAQSCEPACRESHLANLVYTRPPTALGMVDNWNHALQFARGDYVCVLTDKMFLLPDALARIASAIQSAGDPDIATWTSDFYTPADFADYFGPGQYGSASPRLRTAPYRGFSPGAELSRRGRAEVARTELSNADYCRGKLVFGAYRRDLLEAVVRRFGSVFHNINPDYTSMILGLSAARSAIEIQASCVVSVVTDISNGVLSDASDAAALAYLGSLAGWPGTILPNLLVPGVYASQHNWVAHDYITLRRRFDLTFDLDVITWLAYVWEDIHRPSRQWSSELVEAEQKRLLHSHLESLGSSVLAAVNARIAVRSSTASHRSRVPRLLTLRRLVPQRYRRHLQARSLDAAIDRTVELRGAAP
jgi:glycosyltransferase involved in cell wall biosynthesis